ncbi:hypothetical protein [Ammoniphilus sp. CFH 90114]|uniref:hypothetical protein n=1 Tax=Ammoniphilus sp. CFH 90114 TaxID=2493665 RepID=UPI00100FA60F|nr:hypothetical protein [Ammoniphilus sp. CFH 90114]RXT15353.1 hypothetical protein EIZ39_03880 [Ammoniphilus sp. CFH 90114]
MDAKTTSDIEKIVNILENDGAFTMDQIEVRAKDILEELKTKMRVEFSPTRYGVIRKEEGMMLLAVFEKGHHVNPDQMIEEFPLA